MTELPLDIDAARARFGLKVGDVGAHTSRTMMLADLRDLLAAATQNSSRQSDYRDAVVDASVLGKRTLASRRLAFQRLSELYGLDPSIPVFRVLRQLWPSDRTGRPMLAFLVAFARDPLLRATAAPVLRLTAGRSVAAAQLDDELRSRLGTRLNPAVRHKVARNAASTWTQSGHLAGRVRKVRATPVITPSVVALATLLATINGAHGRAIFASEYVQLLDRPSSQLTPLLQEAHRAGLINFKQAGDIVELRFPDLLTPAEEGLIHGL